MTRRIVLVVLIASGTLAGLAAPSRATNLATLNLSSTAGRPGDTVTLTYSSDDTGAGRLRGQIVVGGERLVADATVVAHSRWADVDGDGVAGVTHIDGTFSRTGQVRSEVAVPLAPETDIDQSGAYRLHITLGERTFTVEVNARRVARGG